MKALKIAIQCLLVTAILGAANASYAAITFVAETSLDGNDDRGSLTVPGSTAVDDVMLVQVVIRNRSGSDGVTAPSGWTIIGSQESDGDVLQSLYYKVATAGDAGTSYEWDFDGNGNRRYIMGMSVYRGVDTTSPVDVHNANTGMSGNQITAPSVTTSQADSMLVAFYALEAGDQSFTPASGMSELYDEEEHNNNNGIAAMAAYALQASSGASGNKNATASKSNDDAIGHLVALTPSSGGGPGSCAVADNFTNVSYSQNDGSVNWTGDWVEVAEADGPSAGIARVRNDNCSSGNCLRLGVPSGGGSQTYSDIGVYREVDLAGASAATLTFNYRTGYASGTPTVRLWASNDGGSNWSLLQTYSFSSTSFTAVAQTFDLTPYIASNTRIRFLADGTSAVTGFYVDDLEISHDGLACTSLLAEWRMDEFSWSGAANEIVDNSGNGYDARSVNSAATGAASPALAGNPGTCGYGVFDGSNDYVEVPSALPNLSGDFTISAWIYAEDIGKDQRIFADDESNTGGFAFSLGDGGDGRLRFFSRSVSPVEVDTQSAVIAANQWYFVTAVHNASAKTRQIYVNGVAQTLNTGSAISTYTGSWGTDTGTASIGGETNASPEGTSNWAFDGRIDEVRVYDSALSQSQIAAIYAETHACAASSVDHYEITTSGSFLTCEPITVTITGHDVSDNPLAPGAGTNIDLSITATSPAEASWSNPSEGSLVDSGNGNATYTFGASSAITLNFNYGVIGDVNFNINASGSPQEGGGEDPTVTFKNSGFRIVDGGNVAIGSQISGKNSGQYFLQAVETDTNTMACVGAFADGTLANIDWAIECENPSTCIASTNMAIDYTDNAGSQSASITAQDDVASPTFTTLNNMLFASDSKTPIDINYPEAGRININTRYSVLDGDGNATGDFITGASQVPVVPAGLCVTVDDMDGAGGPRSPDCSVISNHHTCSIYIEAGAAFDLNVTAKAWQTNGEANSDFCDNVTTANFALNTINLTPNLIAPTLASGGVNGALNATSVNIVSNGTVKQSETFTEVGVFTFTATPSLTYFGETIAASTSANVGRFIPDHFRVDPSGVPIILPDTGYHYLGKPFSVAYDVQAFGSGGIKTTNYRDAFAFLNVITEITYGAVDTAAPLSFNGARLIVPTTGLSCIWNNGDCGLTVPMTIERGATPDGPFTSVDIGVVMTDSDGVTLRPTPDINLDTDLDTADDRFNLGTVPGDLRYGRAFFPPVYGPELPAGASPGTELPFEVQFFDGTNYVRNILDNVTAYNSWGLDSCVDLDASDGLLCAETAVNQATAGAVVAAGISNAANPIILSRPGAGNTGSLGINIAVDSWLQHDWFVDVSPAGGNGVDDNANVINPFVRATFGTYRGHDRIIYWRELSP